MKKFFILAITIAAAAVVLIALILVLRLENVHRDFSPRLMITGNNYQENTQCPIQEKRVTVRGTSMYPAIKPGDEVTALFGYYNCHSIERGDVVLYDYYGDENLLIKFVKAIPGDAWSLKETSGDYEIVVNDSVLINAEGEPYLISDYKMLKLYATEYPIVPNDTYLILGDETNGSLDSTHFGLISAGEIKAKVSVN